MPCCPAPCTRYRPAGAPPPPVPLSGGAFIVLFGEGCRSPWQSIANRTWRTACTSAASPFPVHLISVALSPCSIPAAEQQRQLQHHVRQAGSALQWAGDYVAWRGISPLDGALLAAAAPCGAGAMLQPGAALPPALLHFETPPLAAPCSGAQCPRHSLQRPTLGWPAGSWASQTSAPSPLGCLWEEMGPSG